MKTVWKYTVPTDGTFGMNMPAGAEVLSVHVQNGVVNMWVEVDPDVGSILKRFRVCGTGHDMPADEPRRFVGSYLLHGATEVYHLFEIVRPPVRHELGAARS